jgi:hypothetical protein
MLIYFLQQWLIFRTRRPRTRSTTVDAALGVELGDDVVPDETTTMAKYSDC